VVTRILAGLRQRVLRAILALGRRSAPRAEDDDLGLLLSPERRGGSVALIWALEAEPGAESQVEEALRTFDTVVFVTDGLDFLPFVRAGRLFEAVPGQAVRAAAPDRDWGRYLARRVDRIRRAWQPDFEAVLGQSPEAFVEAAGLAATQSTATRR
jgi:hypothetical protein